MEQSWLGIDVGGTKVALAVGDAQGSPCAQIRRETEPSGSAERDLDRIAADALRLLEQAGVGPDRLVRVGVSVPGPLDPETGVVHNPPNLPGWDRAPVRERLARALGAPVILENDANAAALAEWRFGAGRGFQHMVYLTMSTGIGGGLILGGRLHRGVLSSAGEIGHAPVVWNGEPCACGQRGCLEAYIGGAAWKRRLRREAPLDSRVVALAGGREKVRPEEVVQAAAEGDAYACAELDRFNDYLAHGIALLAYTLAPEAVVLGTIPTAAGERLCLEPVRRRVAAAVWPFLAERMQILPAALGKELPYRAGLAVALEPERGD